MIKAPARQGLLSGRVDREREAHTANDVLAESERLKQRFAQVFTAPHVIRMEAVWQNALAEVDGLRILDYGCGRGDLGIELAKRGATVIGIDISENYVAEANARARAAGLRTKATFQTADAHAMPFDDGQFDLIVGSGILHHLDINTAVTEIARVLKHGGTAMFKEPLVGGPWMWAFRALTPRARTVDERPLSEATLSRLDRMFRVNSTYYGFLVPVVAASISAILPDRVLKPVLCWTDVADRQIAGIRIARSWHQYVLLSLQRADDP